MTTSARTEDVLAPDEQPSPAPASPPDNSAAARIGPTLQSILGEDLPVRFSFWDNSSFGPADASHCVRFCSKNVLRRLVWSPGELGLARAYVLGEIEFEGDLYSLLRRLAGDGGRIKVGARTLVRAFLQALFIAGPLPPGDKPVEELKGRGRRHSKARDAAAIRHHYDVGNEFYELVLGPSLTYSCARFVSADDPLEVAQAAKHELICRKLGLSEHPGMRLLDVGCGWGSLLIHAAQHHDAFAVGISLSAAQVERAKSRVAELGLMDRIEVRLQDYRDLHGERFDAISSVGMFEHVGEKKMAQYFETLRDLLGDKGRLLNHAIAVASGSKMQGRSFINRYVFPDGELLDVADVLKAMERSGFEARDVESLREHYTATLRAWVRNLEANWDRAVELVGEGRARVWLLYMAASANRFEEGRLSVYQVLGTIRSKSGESGMPPTRLSWG